mgnify:CR=1 FL=1
MSENAAASETGYYYITGAPVNKINNNKYIYYYDMVKDILYHYVPRLTAII